MRAHIVEILRYFKCTNLFFYIFFFPARIQINPFDKSNTAITLKQCVADLFIYLFIQIVGHTHAFMAPLSTTPITMMLRQ